MENKTLHLTTNSIITFLTSESLFYKTENFLKSTKHISFIDILLTKICETIIQHKNNLTQNSNKDIAYLIKTSDQKYGFIFKFGFQINDSFNKFDIIFCEYNSNISQNNIRVDEYVTNIVTGVINDSIPSEQWDREKLNKILEQEEIFVENTNFITEEMCDELEVNEIVDKVLNEVHKMYDAKIKANEENLGINFGNVERNALLNYVDKSWVEHIDNMSLLRREISTRQDPIIAYKNEGYDMFENMISNIRTNTAKYLLKREMKIMLSPEEAKKIFAKLQIAVEQSEKAKKAKTVVKKEEVGRNDLCPCGSGKKFKNCCGK